MANPQPTDAHLRIAHSITEAIMLRDFTKRQRNILDLILRLSWGCGKKSAIIPHQRDFGIVGVKENHIKEELQWLEQSHIILREECTYSFNKDFDQWQVSRVHPFHPEKLTELVSLNLEEKTSQNGKLGEGLPGGELPETGSQNFPKRETDTSRKGKLSTSEIASPKERVKEILKESSTSTAAVITEEKTSQNGKLLPNIFTLYEQEIGKLTPEVSDALKDIEKQYPADWIPLAFKEAAGRARSWKYIDGILKRWSAEGGPLPPAAPNVNTALLTAAQEQPSPDIDPVAAWDQVKSLVKKRVNAMNYNSYFEGTIGQEWRGVCLVVQASPIHAEYYNTKVRSLIESALIEVTGNKCLVICEENIEVKR